MGLARESGDRQGWWEWLDCKVQLAGVKVVNQANANQTVPEIGEITLLHTFISQMRERFSKGYRKLKVSSEIKQGSKITRKRLSLRNYFRNVRSASNHCVCH